MSACRKIGNNKWLVLLIVAGLNFTNAAMWISYAPVTNLAASYYKVGNDEINWLSLVYFVTTVPLGFLATFIIDKYGLHVGIRVGSLCNTVGSLLRIASSADLVEFQSIRFPLVLTGQTLAAFAQPFVLIIPTKVSETWFPESYRTITTTVSAMANPLGVTVSSLLSPYIVINISQIPLVNVIWGIASCVFGVAAIFFICSVVRDEQENPARFSSRKKYSEQIRELFTNKDYIILLVSFGGGIGLTSCFSTILQQILCPLGYSNSYAGICGALITGLGILGAAVLSIIADKTRKFLEISKIALAIATFSVIGFSETLNFSRSPLPAVMCALFGIFTFGIYPICLELSVECTYPVDEALSSGLIIISGQIQGIILIILTTSLGQPLSSRDKLIETCSVDGYNEIQPLDMKVSTLVLASFCVLCACLFIWFFNPPYKRMEAAAQLAQMNSQSEEFDHL